MKKFLCVAQTKRMAQIFISPRLVTKLHSVRDVGSQVDTKIFIQGEGKLNLKVVKILNNPLGRERSRTLHNKKPGSMMTSGGGVFRNIERGGISPHEQEAIQFAGTIGRYLKSYLDEKKFKTLTVVAEPHFLGKIKAAMSPRVVESVITWVEKDLLNISYRDLAQSLNIDGAVF
jgi:protein required for attachment to host cells